MSKFFMRCSEGAPPQVWKGFEHSNPDVLAKDNVVVVWHYHAQKNSKAKATVFTTSATAAGAATAGPAWPHRS